MDIDKNLENKKKILVVDDEDSIREILSYNLDREGYDVIEAEDGEEALEKIKKEKPDLVLLDVMLPKKDGVTVCKEVRYVLGDIALPILMISAKGEETDKIIGLEIGADDYITKPFQIREVIARVKANLRKIITITNEKTEEESDKIIINGSLTIDPQKREVRAYGNLVDLTKKEFDVLLFLVNRVGTVVSREELLQEVWGYGEFLGEIRTIDVTMARLREKIEKDKSTPEYIITKRGVGYYLVNRNQREVERNSDLLKESGYYESKNEIN